MVSVKFTLPFESVVLGVSVLVPTLKVRVVFGFQPGPDTMVTTVPRGPEVGESVSVALKGSDLETEIPLLAPLAYRVCEPKYPVIGTLIESDP